MCKRQSKNMCTINTQQYNKRNSSCLFGLLYQQQYDVIKMENVEWIRTSTNETTRKRSRKNKLYDKTAYYYILIENFVAHT